MANEAAAPARIVLRRQPGAREQRGLDALATAARIRTGRGLAAPEPTPGSWSTTVLGGCLAELSGTGASPSLTPAFTLVHQVQRLGEPVAWITRAESTFFPPDAAEGGIDLAALPVIRLPGRRQCLRAADHLARSGAFGLLVIDLGGCLDLPLAAQTRLAGQALAHGTLILCLTVKTDDEPSLGSLVSVRAHVRRIRRGNGRFVCRIHVLKDKRRGPGWRDEVWCRGPDGVR